MRSAELNHVVGQDKVGNPERPLPPEGTQFLNETGKDVTLVTWKRAEDGNGTIARLLNISDHATDATLHFPRLNLKSAYLCSGVEHDTSDLQIEGNTVRLDFQPFEALTVRLVTR